MARKKIGVVGAGQVGATTALRIAEKGLGDVVLVDIVEGMPQGKALDLQESRSVERHDCEITGSNSYDDLRGCDIVVVTAGVPRKPGMSRDDLLKVNAGIIQAVCDGLARTGTKPILIVVTNPMDAMVMYAFKKTGLPKSKVIGMAGVLDSARFAYFIAEKLKVSIKDISAMVLGSHGDAMVPMPRYTTVSGIPLPDLLPKAEIDALVKRTANGGAEIVNLLKTGSAFYAPASSATAMVEAIVRDENRILPCGAYLDGEYGTKDLFMGVPVKLGEGGIKEILQLKLTPEEQAAFNKSAVGVRDLVKALGL